MSAQALTLIAGGAAAELLLVLLVDQHRGIAVVDRDVVLRVVRPLLHIQRRRHVRDDVPIQDGPDPPRAGAVWFTGGSASGWPPSTRWLYRR
jgi:hypothetical protein